MTTTATYEPRVGDVVGVVDDDGIERQGLIVMWSMHERDPEPWLVAFMPPEHENWMDDSIQRVWFSGDVLRLIAREASDGE